MFVAPQKLINSSTPAARIPLSASVVLPVLEPGEVGCCLLASDARLVSMSRYFAELVGAPVNSLFGQTIRDVLGSSRITVPELLGEGKNIALNLNGHSLYWNVYKIAPGAALAGYYIGTLSKGEQHNELERQLLHKDRLAILGESAAMIAHETIGPLTAIANNAELLLTFSEHNDDETEQCLISIRDEAHRAATLLQNVLAFASNAPLEFRPLSILEVIQESVRLLDRQANRRKIACRIDNAPGLVQVAGSFEHLLQVFCNLIKNAFDASGEGKEILIRIVKGEFCNEQPAIEIDVVDRGEGMSPFQLEHAFDQFFSTKPGGNGTGLGLGVVRRIVAAHQGEIRLESSPGKGTTARVLLPVFNHRNLNERSHLGTKN